MTVAEISARIEYKLFRAIKHRIKRRLSREICEHLHKTVRRGPFEGMRLTGESAWSNDSVAMLLGEYEAEICQEISSVDFSLHDVVLDLGSADGLFAVGLARLSGLPVIAYELCDRSRRLSISNAVLNNVQHLIEFRGAATPCNVAQDLRSFHRPFLIVDIEGNEIDLFDHAICRLLRNATLIVENHEVRGEGSVDILSRRLESTHEMTLINKGTRNPFCHEVLSELSEDFAYLMLSEERCAHANWAKYTPRVHL